MPAYTLLMHPEALARLRAYRQSLAGQGTAHAGGRLRQALAGDDVAALSDEAFLGRLLATRPPLIFAESGVYGDGRDWTLDELGLLGDVGIAAEVEVYDDGRHHAPTVHPRPFAATLLFIPGALLRNDTGHSPADWAAVTRDGGLDPEAYRSFCERRLCPVFSHANDRAMAQGRDAFITVPGLGCGQFAGPFRGRMGEHLREALVAIFQRHARRWPAIRAVYFDPYDECDNARETFGDLAFLVRPLRRGNDRPQLLQPRQYAEAGDDFNECRLFSVVAWDPVSWPGNDFYGGSRCTDDGVKAAATNVMRVMTGIEGRYDPARHAYLPPRSYRDWAAVVTGNRLRLGADGMLSVLA